MIKKELRTELRSLLAEDLKLIGRVLPYGERSKPKLIKTGDVVYTVYEAGCFGDSLTDVLQGRKKIKCNVEHSLGASDQFGSTDINVELSERADGLYASITLPDTQAAHDLYKNIKLGFVEGLSVEHLQPVSYRPKISRDSEGNYIQTYTADSGMILDGFAITAKPYFPGARLIALSDDKAEVLEKDIEDFKQREAETQAEDEASQETEQVAVAESTAEIEQAQGGVPLEQHKAHTQLKIDAILEKYGYSTV